MYRHLWSHEHDKGMSEGVIGRKCLIVSCKDDPKSDTFKVRLLGISHSVPKDGQTGVRIPPEDAKEIGVDNQSWIKTSESNLIDWPRDRLPFGVTRSSGGEFVVGWLKNATGQKAHEEFVTTVRARQHQEVSRDEAKAKAAFDERIAKIKERHKDYNQSKPDGDKPRGGQRQ